jgi:hypothetical protein
MSFPVDLRTIAVVAPQGGAIRPAAHQRLLRDVGIVGVAGSWRFIVLASRQAHPEYRTLAWLAIAFQQQLQRVSIVLIIIDDEDPGDISHEHLEFFSIS